MTFLIPFRTDNGPRQDICDWTIARIRFFFPNAKVITAPGLPGEFNRSSAINQAFSMSDREGVVIVNDSDTVWNPHTILNGYNSLIYDTKFVIPYDKYHIMDRPSSSRLTASPVHTIIHTSEYDYDIVAEANSHVYHAPPVSGVCMMKAEDFGNVLFDERFVGWGEEDVAFVIRAAGKLGKPLRLKENVYHIWHPKSAEYSQPHYKQNQRLLRKEYL